MYKVCVVVVLLLHGNICCDCKGRVAVLSQQLRHNVQPSLLACGTDQRGSLIICLMDLVTLISPILKKKINCNLSIIILLLTLFLK